MRVNAEAFRRARENQLISVLGLAKKAEVSGKVIRNLELGKTTRLESIRKIINALGYTLEEAREKRLVEED
ncbi:MAG: helix-turn-helix domain-containing protein [Deltaproteobacteria bacterium]|jgi:predicted transcriptional regulator|nr:helix-turn-helix domain-containing protein [Deltaproteobacteria bacterium]MDR1309067.1 helix-turn-helix domain-containing protein [Deltaproteobacteria bacterium]